MSLNERGRRSDQSKATRERARRPEYATLPTKEKECTAVSRRMNHQTEGESCINKNGGRGRRFYFLRTPCQAIVICFDR
jgi:hypothetical protein